VLDSDQQSQLSISLSSILEPFARLWLRHEFSYAELIELARMSYLQTAHTHFLLPYFEMTNARIAVLLGMMWYQVTDNHTP